VSPAAVTASRTGDRVGAFSPIRRPQARTGLSASYAVRTVGGMLRLLSASDSRPYRVPWTVDRADERHPHVTNDSDEPLDFVRIFRSDGHTEHWGQVLPEETVEICLCGVSLSSVTVTIAWYRWSTDEEYCWRFVM